VLDTRARARVADMARRGLVAEVEKMYLELLEHPRVNDSSAGVIDCARFVCRKLVA